MNNKLSTLTEEELEQVSGGIDFNLLRTLMGIIFEPPASMTGGQTVSERPALLKYGICNLCVCRRSTPVVFYQDMEQSAISCLTNTVI